MDLTKMTVTELKAMAYDQLAVMENCQKNIVAIKQEIAKKEKEKPKDD